MGYNEFMNEHGQLIKGVMMNIAEILTLRLPEGVGAKVFNEFYPVFILSLLQNASPLPNGSKSS
jgi:hypothetical protein